MLAIFQNDRVYEGNAVLLNAVYPRPCLSQVVADPATRSGAEIFARVNPLLPLLFREDSFDPTTRIRRGRFYESEPGRRQWAANQVNHYPYAQPIVGMPLFYDMEAYSPLQPQRAGVRLIVLLGGANYATAWRIVAAERMFNGETLFTLKSANSLGILPDMIESALPTDKGKEIFDAFEKVADAANIQLPVSVVDVCREFVRVVLAAWLPTLGGNAEGKDLRDLINVVPDDRPSIKYAAGIINRLHSRGKSAVHENQAQRGRPIRNVCNEDGQLSVSLVGFLLRELRWAE